MAAPLDHPPHIPGTIAAQEDTQPSGRDKAAPSNPAHERTQPTLGELTQPNSTVNIRLDATRDPTHRFAVDKRDKPEITRANSNATAQSKQNVDVRQGQLLKSSFEEHDLRTTLDALGYRVISYLASGGSADILLAEQSNNNDKVVVKIMDHSHSTDRNSTKLLIQEFTLMSRLDTPHVIKTIDRGYTLNTTFITMEYLAGGTLSARIKKGVPLAAAISYILQIASGLAVIHDARIIHRDIKPDNILFRLDETAVITDFGIAKLVGASAGLTFSGHIVGTPSYLAPELLSGNSPSIQSDLYSMGIMLYEMLVGKRPFRGANYQEIFDAHIKKPIPQLPAGLASFQPVIDRLLAKQPGDRYPGCGELISDLKSIHLT